MLVAALYLLAGQLHGAHDIDVTSPAGGSEIVMMLDHGAAGHGDHKALAGHHCHGCFSVAVDCHSQDATLTEALDPAPSQPQARLAGIAPDMDPRPPRT